MKPFDDRIEQLGPVNTDDDFRQENVKVRSPLDHHNVSDLSLSFCSALFKVSFWI
jgi:hypothetical protein